MTTRPYRAPTCAHNRRRTPLPGALLAALAGLAVLAAASAAEARAPAPEAADKTLGMAILSASVAGDGSRVRDAGVAAVERVSLGTFRVTFERSIATCTCTASAGANDVNAALYGLTAAANCPYFAADSARINIANSGGQLVDAPFHVLVFCPK